MFPAIFLGTAGGLLAANLPGFPEGAAVAAVMGAMIATVLRLPLSAVVITMVMTGSAGPEALPLTIIAVVIANVTTEKLYAARRTSAAELPPDAHAGEAAAHLAMTSGVIRAVGDDAPLAQSDCPDCRQSGA